MAVMTDSSNSTDTLPIVGYTTDQLANYIFRQLGYPTWQVELTKQQVLDAIQDALVKYSQYKPMLKYQALQLSSGVFQYLKGVDLGSPGAPALGVVHVDFVEPNPVPTEIFYGNLIDPAPLFRTGLDEYDSFLRWRKTWTRVTSIQPDWLYDDNTQSLYIHNPIARYHCGIVIYVTWAINRLPIWGADWVKLYALAKARYTYGEVLAKFSGAVPAPVNNMQLDQAKRQEAEKALNALETRLFNAMESTPLIID